jgi:hypothetical protein
MNTIDHLIPTIRAFRPFLPAKDYETSLKFYEAIGFKSYPLGETMAGLSFGPHAFLLQGHYVKEWAENMMMHVLVHDLLPWWKYIDSLDLEKFGVLRPSPPKAEPWGLTIVYVFDPSGVLWHFAQLTAQS